MDKKDKEKDKMTLFKMTIGVIIFFILLSLLCWLLKDMGLLDGIIPGLIAIVFLFILEKEGKV